MTLEEAQISDTHSLKQPKVMAKVNHEILKGVVTLMKDLQITNLSSEKLSRLMSTIQDHPLFVEGLPLCPAYLKPLFPVCVFNHR